jgi:hypothetical protein
MTEVITPSSQWQGDQVEGSRWTTGQIHALRQAGRNPDTVATATVLRRPRVNAENWLMPPVPVRHVLPRLAITRDGRRAKVITPAGAVIWMEIARG